MRICFKIIDPKPENDDDIPNGEDCVRRDTLEQWCTFDGTVDGIPEYDRHPEFQFGDGSKRQPQQITSAQIKAETVHKKVYWINGRLDGFEITSWAGKLKTRLFGKVPKENGLMEYFNLMEDEYQYYDEEIFDEIQQTAFLKGYIAGYKS